MKMLHNIRGIRMLMIVLILCCLAPVGLRAQSCRLFATEDALPNTLVNAVVEDADYMIWVATEYGLCKFDGSKFTTYLYEAGNPHSLQDNYVRSLFVDSKGRLLIGTRRGLQMYRPETDDFSLLALFEGTRRESGDVSRIIERENGEIWLSGNSPCCARLDGDSLWLYQNAFTNKIKYTETLMEDQLGRIWTDRHMKELYRLETDGSITRIRHNGADLPFNALFTAADGTIYAGGQLPGLYRYVRETDTFELVNRESGDQFIVRDIIEWKDGQLLVATDNEGLKVYNCQTHEISDYLFDDGRVDARSQKVHAVCIDHNQVMWLALYQKGVMMVPQSPQPFIYLGAHSSNRNSVGDKCVTSICPMSDHQILVATDNGGMFVLDEEGRQLRHFTTPPMPTSIMGVFEDSRHRIWYGTYSQGYGWIDPKTGMCKELTLNGQSSNSSNIYDFAEDHLGRIWIASMGSGLYLFDEEKQTAVVPSKYDSCTWASCLYVDTIRHNLYIGSYTGLTEVDLQDLSRRSKQYLGDKIVFSVSDYTDGRLAVCTSEGLIIFEIGTGRFVRYTVADGLPSDLIFSAQCDDCGLLWVSTNAGLSCFNEKRGTFTNYSVHDGLQSNEFFKHASMKEPSGLLWFGGTNGITYFDPREVNLEGVKCEVRIVEVLAGGRTVKNRNQHEFDDNSFSFEMATLPIEQTRHAVYSYSLDNDPWTSLHQGQNLVSFSHITPGSHVFRYKATIADVDSEVKTYRFYVAYPWYRQWWAVSSIILLLLIVVYLSVKQLKHRHEIRKRLARHVQIQAINEAKLQFFMNIAHEIRTPMTMIVSPLQKLMSSDTDTNRQHAYHTMQRNADRIVGLINQLMDLRKIDKKQMKLYCTEVAIAPYIQDVCDSMQDVADVRQIQLSFENQTEEGLKLWIDTSNFDKILINLLSNAMKYTPSGGKVDVLIQQDKANPKYPDGRFVLTVTDTGEGIPYSEKSRVFERFYQVRTTASGKSGTGIGLHLTASLVKLHHGEIRVFDNPAGQGTRFVVTLPLGHAHLKAVEMSEKTTDPQQVVHPDTLQVNPDVFITETEHLSKAAPVSDKVVIIAEDDDEIRQYIVNELSFYCQVVECSNGKEAFDSIMRQTPDLLISDVMMPEMDGFELCRKIRSNVRLNHIPIVLLTAKSDEDSRLESLDLGADAFLTKPFSMEVLRKTVKNLLTNRARLRNSFSGQQMPLSQVDTPEGKSPDERLMERVVRVINENLSNPELTTEMIANEVGMSRVHLYRKLKELTNQSGRNYIRNIRLAKAAELLSQKKMPVTEVSDMVGFTNPSNFTTAFKELYGVKPTTYMEQHLKKEEEHASKD